MINRTIILAASLGILLASAAFGAPQKSEQLVYVPLNANQMEIFLNTLNEISMPNRVYQQIIAVYRNLETQAQKDAQHKSKAGADHGSSGAQPKVRPKDGHPAGSR